MPGLLRVRVAVSPRPGEAYESEVELAEGASSGDAVRASGVVDRWLGGVEPDPQQVGVWGRVRGTDVRLSDGDRVEVYRPLAVDPKEARRRRARRR